jgi:probable HAF family extracellular repeat protein
MTDLGVVSSDFCSIAYVINSGEQIVDGADDCQGNNQYAFVWEKGSIADLNTLIPVDSGVQLTVAVGLNERGDIAAQGMLPDGNLHAFLLTPCDENHSGIDGCDYSQVDATAAAQVHTPQGTQTRSGAMQNGIPIGLRGRLLSRMARRYPMPSGTTGSER